MGGNCATIYFKHCPPCRFWYLFNMKLSAYDIQVNLHMDCLRQERRNWHYRGEGGLPRITDPDMHRGTCVTHVPWCIPGSLTSGFLWSRWWGKRSRHFRRMHNPQFYVSGKRPMMTFVKDTRFSSVTARRGGHYMLLCFECNTCLLEQH